LSIGPPHPDEAIRNIPMDAATGDEVGRRRMRAAWTGAQRTTRGHSGVEDLRRA
jgi:hypothetical protein